MELVVTAAGVSTVAWFAVAMAFLWRWKGRLAPDLAFVAFAIGLGVTAALEGLSISAGSAGDAVSLYRLRQVAATVSSLVLVWFAKWATVRRTRWDLLLVLPLIPSVVLSLGGVVTGAELQSWGWSPRRDPLLYGVWLLQVLGYAAAAIGLLWKGSRALAMSSGDLRRFLYGSIVAILLGLFLGALTTIAAGLGGTTGTLPFATLMVIPAAIFSGLLALLPQAELWGVLRRLLYHDRHVLAAAVVDEYGRVFALATSAPSVAGASYCRMRWSCSLPVASRQPLPVGGGWRPFRNTGRSSSSDGGPLPSSPKCAARSTTTCTSTSRRLWMRSRTLPISKRRTAGASPPCAS